MAAIIFAFVYKYFFAALLTFVVGMFSKALIKDFGNDRADKIKKTILSAMLWAEEQFGIGNGTQKWEEAWKKIRELLQAQGIKLKSEEIPVVEVLMKSNVPKINSIVYSALPDVDLLNRKVINRSPEVTEMIDKLKDKYPPKPTV